MIDLLRAAPYVRMHRGATFVVKAGGGSLARPALRRRFAEQLAVVTALGTRIVVVHGGGPQTDALSRQLGEEPRLVGGRRVTTETALRALRLATVGGLNGDVVEALRAAGVDAVGLTAADAGTVRARRRPPVETADGTVDFGLVGDVEAVDPRVLRVLLDEGVVPVVAPPAADVDGGLLNVNADVVAAALAGALDAAKLVLLTGAPGILEGPAGEGPPISALSLERLRALSDSGALAGGMTVKAAAIESALEGGVPRVHVVSGADPDALLRELYTTHGAGTLVTLHPESAPAVEPSRPEPSAAAAAGAGGRVVSDVADLLAALVAVESVSGDEARAAAFAARWLEERGVSVTRVGDNVIGEVGAGDGPTLLYLSHLDTVPVGAGWTRPPHRGVWEGDVLFGRGANDAKASVAAMMAAVAGLATGGLPAGRLRLALTAREETDNAGVAEVLAHAGRPEAAVTGEPTGLEVVRAQAGLVVLEATWTGSSCHAAHAARVPHENALLAAARDLAGAPPAWTLGAPHPLLGASTAAVTVLRAGDRHNVVPDRADAVVDARLAPSLTAADAAAFLAARLPNAKIHVRSDRLRPVETDADHPLVRAALAAAGRDAAVGSATLSDMAFLAGVPAVKCGPGETARSHTPDEFVRRDELEAGAAFYARLAPAALAALAPRPAPEIR